MFKLVNDLAFWWPVTVVEPDTDEPGEVVEHTFEAQFVVLDRDETRRFADIRTKLLAEASTAVDDTQLKAISEKLDDNEIASIRRALRNWRGIVDAADKPIVFDEVTFAAAMKHDRVRNGLLLAYQKAVTQEKGRLKN